MSDRKPRSATGPTVPTHPSCKYKLRIAFSHDMGEPKMGEIGSDRFVGEIIKGEMSLCDENGLALGFNVHNDLKYTLLISTPDDLDLRPSPAGVLRVDDKSDIKFNGKKATVHFSVMKSSFSLDNAQFVFKVELGAIDGQEVEPAYSGIFITCKQRLVATTSTQTSGTTTKRDTVCTFYKDEGGHGNCIEAFVELVGADNRRVPPSRDINLKIDLRYDKKKELLPISLLTINSDSRLVINEQGWVKIKFRINEVSTRHQGQHFVVVISAHKGDEIAAATSTPIEVRSKRNKPRSNTQADKKRKAQASATVVERVAKQQYNGSSHGNGHHHSQHQQYQHNGYHHPGNSHPNAYANGGYIDMDYGAQNQFMQGNGSGVGFPGGPHGHYPTDSSYGGMVEADNAAAFGGHPIMPQSVGEAVEQITKWTRNVLNTAQQITWQEIGINPNTNEQLFRMPNPNQKLQLIIMQYNQSVRNSLTYLLNYDMVQVGMGGAMGMALGNGNNQFGVGVGDGLLDANSQALTAQNLGMARMTSTASIRRQGSTYSSFSMLDDILGQTDFESDDDHQISYVFAKALIIGEVIKGLPAFDDNKELVGFYNQRQEDPENPYMTTKTQVYFVPLVRSEMSEEETTKVKNFLKEVVERDSNKLLRKDVITSASESLNSDMNVGLNNKIGEKAMEAYFMDQQSVEMQPVEAQ